jgi:hypothetical protein
MVVDLQVGVGKMAKCFGILHPFFYFSTRSVSLGINGGTLRIETDS